MTVSAQDPGARLLDVDLKPERGEVARARRATRSALCDFAQALIDDAELVVSELVTNAVLHAGGGAVALTALMCGEEALELRVSDTSGAAPRERNSGEADEDGRGLLLCRALAVGFGWEALPGGGKTVWARLAVAAAGNGSKG
jgi:anti-sigma regulatory factor (Ser/Thr protein kinase)